MHFVISEYENSDESTNFSDKILIRMQKPDQLSSKMHFIIYCQIEYLFGLCTTVHSSRRKTTVQTLAISFRKNTFLDNLNCTISKNILKLMPITRALTIQQILISFMLMSNHQGMDNYLDHKR